jgi:hypothetical protein
MPAFPLEFPIVWAGLDFPRFQAEPAPALPSHVVYVAAAGLTFTTGVAPAADSYIYGEEGRPQ